MLSLNSTTALNPLAGSLRYKYIGRLQSPSYLWEPRYTQLPQRHQRRAAAHPGYSSTQGPGCGAAQPRLSALPRLTRRQPTLPQQPPCPPYRHQAETMSPTQLPKSGWRRIAPTRATALRSVAPPFLPSGEEKRSTSGHPRPKESVAPDVIAPIAGHAGN